MILQFFFGAFLKLPFQKYIICVDYYYSKDETEMYKGSTEMESHVMVMVTKLTEITM